VIRVRIAVSGTHASGKTTLIEDFLAAHADYAFEPEPYEWLDQMSDPPAADDFYRQLEICVERLSTHERGARVIAERSPVDFLAYLRALDARDLIEPALELVATGMRHVDLLVVLPLNDTDRIDVPESEDPALREAMNDQLLEIIGGYELGCAIIEIAGPRDVRLAVLERAVATR